MGRPAKPLDRIKLYDHYTFDPTIPQLLRVKTPYGQSKRKRLVRTVLIFTESSDQLSRATDRVPGLPASPGYVQ